MARFHITHEFRAPDLAAFWRCYFDPGHVAQMDAKVQVKRREPLVERDDGDALYREVKLIPERQLPGFLRKIVGGELHYIERTTFYKRDDRIEFMFIPSFLAARTKMEATYTVVQTAPGRLLRTYDGVIEVDVPVVGKRIERAVVRDMESSLVLAAESTQAWLDEHEPQAAPAAAPDGQ
jgi:hypothetical protein